MITFTGGRVGLLWDKMKEKGSKIHLFIHNFHHPLRGILAVLIFLGVLALMAIVITGFSKAQVSREETLDEISRMICILTRAEPDMTAQERLEIDSFCEAEIERLQRLESTNFNFNHNRNAAAALTSPPLRTDETNNQINQTGVTGGVDLGYPGRLFNGNSQ